jgi:hypothetical protein
MAVLNAAAVDMPRLWDGFNALKWILARRHVSGGSIQGSTSLYYLYRQDPGGFGVPGFTIVYTVSDSEIEIHAIRIIR